MNELKNIYISPGILEIELVSQSAVATGSPTNEPYGPGYNGEW